MKKKLLFAIAFVIASCIASPATDDAPADTATDEKALTAEDQGLELMLPFEPTSLRTLTRAYGIDTHTRHGEAHWDDAYALDFAGDDCAAWGAPVLAAETGVAMTLPAGVAPGSDAATAYERSYGARSVILDHGNGCYSQYAHLSARDVVAGQKVARGQTIGREGNEGNVSGTSCPSHPGTHLHFKVWCGKDAIVPEPLSGYHGLQGFVGKRFAHHALHHPPGTLVQAIGTPKIYLIDGPRSMRHIADEKVWRSYRFFQERTREWATVVPVSSEELECHDQGPPLTAPAKLVATTCSDRMFIAFDDGRTRWRKRILFTPSQAGHRILMRSWGFAPDEIVRGSPWGCAIPVSADPLPLRDGTVIEQASDDDFYVIADGGIAYRLRRALMRVLYGDGWPMVIQVPDGSVPSLTRGVDPSRREFTLADMTTCPNRRRTLETSLADGSGGAAINEGPVTPTTPPPVISPPPPVIPGTDPGSTPRPPHTIACTRSGTTLAIDITGPVTDALVGTTIVDPVAIELGSDRYGWSNDARRIPWIGDRDPQGVPTTHHHSAPADLGRFNFTLVGKDGSMGWFDLPDADWNGTAFTVTGDCVMICAPDSCAIIVK